MNNRQEHLGLSGNIETAPSPVLTIDRRDESEANNDSIHKSRKFGLIHFINELRRRNVCRTATMYAVALWLICQVVDLIYIELGLPDWTLKFVIVLGLLGLPITLILSWLIDITPDGLVLDGGGTTGHHQITDTKPRDTIDRVIECALAVAAIAIGIQLAVGGVNADAHGASASSQRIAVQMFRTTSDSGDLLADELAIELQHELRKVAGVLVIASTETYLTEDSQILSGRIAVYENQIRVTATMTNNSDGSITWSQIIQQPRTDLALVPAKLAQDIVAALPLTQHVQVTSQVQHDT